MNNLLFIAVQWYCTIYVYLFNLLFYFILSHSLYNLLLFINVDKIYCLVCSVSNCNNNNNNNNYYYYYYYYYCFIPSRAWIIWLTYLRSLLFIPQNAKRVITSFHKWTWYVGHTKLWAVDRLFYIVVLISVCLIF